MEASSSHKLGVDPSQDQSSPSKKGPDKGKGRELDDDDAAKAKARAAAYSRIELIFDLPFANEDRNFTFNKYSSPLYQDTREVQPISYDISISQRGPEFLYLLMLPMSNVHILEACFRLSLPHDDPRIISDLRAAIEVLIPCLSQCEIGFRLIMVGQRYEKGPYDALAAIRSKEAILALFKAMAEEERPGMQVRTRVVEKFRIFLKGDQILYRSVRPEEDGYVRIEPRKTDEYVRIGSRNSDGYAWIEPKRT